MEQLGYFFMAFTNFKMIVLITVGTFCGIYIGAVTPAAPATTASPEGAPVCQ